MTSLRADAARNVVQIRAAAIAAFRGRGLSTPLEEIAEAAGVSKATIYNRFGGRDGLVDAVIGELVAGEMHAIIGRAAAARGVTGAWDRFVAYVVDRRDLQYREPAFTDALLMAYPESPQLIALGRTATAATEDLMREARATGELRRDVTAADLYYADVANGLALRALPRPPRDDYDRRTRFLLDSMRPH